VVVNEIGEKVKRAASIVLVNARGLTVEQDTSLRKKLREAGVDYKVYKNTMINFAIKDTPFEGLSKYLEGPTAVAFCFDEPITAAKLISKELKAMPKLEFKAGVIESALYDAKGIEAIANIPPRNELLSRLLGSFKAPAASFARLAKALAEKNDAA
jgi:large subunit ribosomal protein L10